MTKIAAANAKRIAWSLSLQQIMDFPKHFLAPTAFASSRRRMHGLKPDAEGSTVSPRYVMTFQEAKSRGTGQSPTQGWQRPTPPASFVARAEVRNLRSENFTGSLSRAIGWRSDISSAPSSKPIKPIVVYNRQSRAPNRLPEIANRPIRSMHAAPGSALAPQHILSDGPEMRSNARLRTGNPGLETAQNSNLGNTTEQDVWQTAGSLPAEFRGSESSLARESSDSSEGSSSERGISGAQKSQPTVTMLHIDGAVLGRWAIQHLERALGRPTSGMTGVDPRATVARSRVAPF